MARQYPLKILIAEDNDTNIKVFKRMFAKLGYEPNMVINGKEAVDICKRQEFDIIFMDMQMPIMNGPKAAKEILQFSSCSNRKKPVIIAITANVFKKAQDMCKNSGMLEFIGKPVKFDDLKAIIRKYGRNRSDTDPIRTRRLRLK